MKESIVKHISAMERANMIPKKMGTSQVIGPLGLDLVFTAGPALRDLPNIVLVGELK
jgi:hypothetical protein